MLGCVGKKSESDTKKLVTAIHELKERQKKEAETLKKIKDQLRDVQERQQKEREVKTTCTSPVKKNECTCHFVSNHENVTVQF